MTDLQNKVNKGQEWSGKLSTLLKGLWRIGTKFKLQLGHSDLILKNWWKDILNSHMQPQGLSKLT